jgi:hypothetical protein
MPALASLDELRRVAADLDGLRAAHGEAYAAFAALLKKHRAVGYKNVCRLLLGETTPEKLKGEQ